MNNLHTWYIIAVITLVTASLRFLPFIVFNGNRKTPQIIEKLSKVLPYSIMGMLVIYCLRNINFSNTASYLPLIISCFIVSVLYIWKRNTLISIVSGTVCYMILVQMVFL